MGLVWAWGKLGAKGKTQLISSLVTGTILGFLYMLAKVRPPEGDWWLVYGYWFADVIYGLGLGLLGSLLYELQKDLLEKIIAALFSKWLNLPPAE